MNNRPFPVHKFVPKSAELEEVLQRVKSSLTLLSSALEELKSLPAQPQARLADDVVHVYWAGCSGLAHLAGDLPDAEGCRRPKREPATFRVDKIGSTSLAIEDRLRLLGSDEYGAWSFDAWGQPKKASGFRNWMAQAIHTTRGSINEAVTVRTRSIDVRLPIGLSRRAFDRRLQEALLAWSFSRRFPNLKRFTSYTFGGTSPVQSFAPVEAMRMSDARELYAGLDPCRDGDRLLVIVETLLEAQRTNAYKSSGGFETPEPARENRSEAAKRSPTRAMSAAQLRAMRLRQRAEGTRRSGHRRHGPA